MPAVTTTDTINLGVANFPETNRMVLDENTMSEGEILRGIDLALAQAEAGETESSKEVWQNLERRLGITL